MEADIHASIARHVSKVLLQSRAGPEEAQTVRASGTTDEIVLRCKLLVSFDSM